MKTKGKSKAIIGIAMTAIMVASVMVAMVTPAAALRSFRTVNNTDGVADIVVIGERVTFTSGATTLQLDADGDGNPDGQILTATAGVFDTKDATTAGIYIATPPGYPAGDLITLTDPIFKISVRDATATNEITSVVAGVSNVAIVAVVNLPTGNPIGGYLPPPGAAVGPGVSGNSDYKLRIVDVEKPSVFISSAITAGPAGTWQVATGGVTGLAPGDYELWIETDHILPEVATIDISSTKKSLTVLTAAIDVEVDRTEQVTGNDVILTITAGVGQVVTVTANGATALFTVGMGDVDQGDTTGVIGSDTYTDTIPPDGDLTTVVSSGTTGAITITARTWVIGQQFTDSLSVSFKKPTAEVVVSVRKIIIGDKVTISGSTTSGVSRVAIFVNDVLQQTPAVEADDTYEWEWDTSFGMMEGASGNARAIKPGSITVKVFDFYPTRDTLGDIGQGLNTNCGGEGAVVGAVGPVSSFVDANGNLRSADASTGIAAVAGDLFASMDVIRVSKEDDIVIYGTADGETQVRVILIESDGKVKWDCYESVLDDGTFEFTATTAVAWNSGTYKAMVITDGRDGTTLLTCSRDISGSPRLPGTRGCGIGPDSDTLLRSSAATIGGTSVSSMTQNQLIETIDSYVLPRAGAAGSDDKRIVLSFKLEDPDVEITEIENEIIDIDQLSVDVTVTDGALTVMGITNRISDTLIMIMAESTVDPKYDLTPMAVYVANGTFTADLDVPEGVTGTYMVIVDDLSQATDELTVGILTAVPTPTPTATPEPTATPTVAPVPTAEPTAEPTPEPTPEEPGFGAVFAIAGMLSIAYLVLRRRK